MTKISSNKPSNKNTTGEVVKAKTMDRESIVVKEDKGDDEMMQVRLGDPNPGFFRVAHFVWWLLCVGGMTVTFIIAHSDGPIPALKPLEIIGLSIFGSRDNMKILFNLAVLAHLIEAQIAIYICLVELRLHSWPLWAIQTMLLGYPSLGMLIERKTYLLRGSVADAAKESAKNK